MRILRIRRDNPDQRRDGAAAVEMALVLPVFLTLLFGMVESGRAMMMSQVIVNASREGARVAASDGATNAAVETTVESYLQQSLGLTGADMTVTITVTPGPGNPDPANNVANASPGDKCTVQTEVPYSNLAIFGGRILDGATLRGFCSMRHEY